MQKLNVFGRFLRMALIAIGLCFMSFVSMADTEEECLARGDFYIWVENPPYSYCAYDYEAECNTLYSDTHYWDGSCYEKDTKYCQEHVGIYHFWSGTECESIDDFCPAFSQTSPSGPWIETPGQWFDLNGDGEKTLDECITMRGYANYMHHTQEIVEYPVYRVYVDIHDYKNNGDVYHSFNRNTIGTGVICRYNPETYNYDLACTQGINLCSNAEILDMMQTAGYSSINLMHYFIGLVEQATHQSIPDAYFNNFFDQDPDNPTLFDRCSLTDAVCPEHSETLANGPIAELTGYGVDFDEDGTITLDECITARVYGDIIGNYFANIDPENVSSDYMFRQFPNFTTLYNLYQDQSTYNNEVSTNSGLLNVAFCRYDSETGNYDGNCTPAITAACTSQSLEDLYGVNGTNFQTRTLFPYMITKVESSLGMSIPTSMYSQLFTNSSSNIGIESTCTTCPFGYDESDCDMVKYENCGPGTYLYVDADNEIAECRTCEPGSYCPNDEYYAIPDGTQGMEGCPGGSTSSGGAVDESDCYCTNDNDYMKYNPEYDDYSCEPKDDEYCQQEHGASDYVWDDIEGCITIQDQCEDDYNFWDSSENRCKSYDEDCRETHDYNWYWDGTQCKEDCTAYGYDGEYEWSNDRYICINTETGCTSHEEYDDGQCHEPCEADEHWSVDGEGIGRCISQDEDCSIYGEYEWDADRNSCVHSITGCTPDEEYDDGQCHEPCEQYYYWYGSGCRPKDDIYCEREFTDSYYWSVDGCIKKDNAYCERELDDTYYWDGGDCIEKDDTYCEQTFDDTYYWDGTQCTDHEDCSVYGDEYEWSDDRGECINNITGCTPDEEYDDGICHTPCEDSEYWYYNGEDEGGCTLKDDTYCERILDDTYYWDGTSCSLRTTEDNTITLYTNGGTFPEGIEVPESYSEEDEPITLPEPTREGYSFGGWYDNAELTGDPITTFTPDPENLGAKGYWAKWGCPTGYTASTENLTDSGTQCRKSCSHIVGQTNTGGYEYYNGDTSSCTYTTAVYTIKYVWEDGGTMTTTNPTSWTFGETQPFDLTTPEIPENWEFYGWFNDNKGFNKNTTSTKITTLTEEVVTQLAGSGTTITLYGHKYPESVFWMTTTPMNANEKFAFYAVFNGTLYIKWEENLVTKTSGSISSLFSHTYNKAGTYKIGLSSKNITNYPDSNGRTVNEDCSSIGPTSTFYITNCWAGTTTEQQTQGTTPLKLAKIEGKLSDVFPTLENGTNPNFINAFCGCENLTGTIPDGFFDKITGQPVKQMFTSTFQKTKLSGNIPNGLFSGLNGTYTDGVFDRTFYDTNLSGPIPENLFGNLYGEPKKCIFTSTFYNNSNLSGPIPDNLFGNIDGAPAQSMFASTFYSCSNLSGPIPDKLFGNLNGAPADYMFSGTFYNCQNLEGSLPENLFNVISGQPATYMYTNTFNGCKKLNGDIPDYFFGHFDGNPASYMFARTFENCSGLTGSIPETLFEGINGPVSQGSFNKTFLNASGLTGQIPKNLFSGITGTENGAFRMTFSGATNLGKKANGESSSIPVDLFKDINGTLPAVNLANNKYPMFEGTFADTQYLTAPVPTELFKGITGYLADNESGTRTSTYTAGGMKNIFANSRIAQVCSAGQYQYLTGFEADWSNTDNTNEHYVACEVCPENYPNSDEEYGVNVNITSCYTDCPEDEHGGTYVSGHKYYTLDEEHIGDTSSCVYQYNINYHLGDVENVSNNSSNPTEYLSNMEEDLTILSAVGNDYLSFVNWYDNPEFNGEPISAIPTGSYGDIDLYAQWTAETYTIEYELNGGENYEDAPETYNIFDEFEFGTPTKQGHNFVHWINDEEQVITGITKGSHGDIRLKAVWEVADFNIIYDYTNGGSGCSNEVYTAGTGKDITCIPTYTGYIFTGWFDEITNGNHITNIGTEATGDITLYAQWAPETYTIEYELNGGENYEDAPYAYTYGIGATIAGIPTRYSFRFLGWCSDEELTDCYEDGYVIPEDATGTQKMYAKWEFECESGKWYHIGDNDDDKICLYTNKTTPSMAIATSDGTPVYLHLTTDEDMKINNQSNIKLRVHVNGNTYNAYDESVNQ